MTKQEREEQKWTLEGYVAHLRLISRRLHDAEVDIVACLARLERKRDLWRPWGLETFAQALNDVRYLGISISPVRYANVKAALEAFGEQKVRRWGIPAARRAQRLSGAARARFVARVEETVAKLRRPLSDQCAYGLYREVAPREAGGSVVDPLDVAARRLERELARTRKRQEALAVQVAVWREVFARARAELASRGIRDFPWPRIFREARAAAARRRAAA